MRLARSMATTSQGRRIPMAPMPRVLPIQKAAQLQNIGRQPLPPMPRILPTSSSSSVVPPPPLRRNSSASRLREWWESGSVLLAIGWTGLAVFALDRYLQYQQRAEAVLAVQALAEDAARQKRALRETWKQVHTPLFYCVIRRAYKQMSGSYGLQGVRVGDVVEVLEEGVGPDKLYNLCRIKKGDADEQIGWFPISFMEKIEPVKTKSLWRRLLRHP